jgi:uncharacterized protein (DUF302 family)
MLTTSYTLSATTPLPFAEAVERVRAELKTEGFGVLCEIDVQATLQVQRSLRVADIGRTMATSSVLEPAQLCGKSGCR